VWVRGDSVDYFGKLMQMIRWSEGGTQVFFIWMKGIFNSFVKKRSLGTITISQLVYGMSFLITYSYLMMALISMLVLYPFLSIVYPEELTISVVLIGYSLMLLHNILWFILMRYIGIKMKYAMEMNIMQIFGVSLSIVVGTFKAYFNPSKKWYSYKGNKLGQVWKYNLVYMGILLLNIIAILNFIILEKFVYTLYFIYNAAAFIYLFKLQKSAPSTHKDKIIRIAEEINHPIKKINFDKLMKDSIAKYEIPHIKVFMFTLKALIVFSFISAVYGLIHVFNVYSGLALFLWTFMLVVFIVYLIQSVIGLNIFYKSVQYNSRNANKPKYTRSLDEEKSETTIKNDGGALNQVENIRFISEELGLEVELVKEYYQEFINLSSDKLKEQVILNALEAKSEEIECLILNQFPDQSIKEAIQSLVPQDVIKLRNSRISTQLSAISQRKLGQQAASLIIFPFMLFSITGVTGLSNDFMADSADDILFQTVDGIINNFKELVIEGDEQKNILISEEEIAILTNNLNNTNKSISNDARYNLIEIGYPAVDQLIET
ncbi:MAG: hypothetical protein KAJ14_14995, partial [Candidatus Omnitrophica bacterium]|nr:hypothetical protein [Candidatus Omnitrophota bacterium]